jgi:hypothetical protein
VVSSTSWLPSARNWTCPDHGLHRRLGRQRDVRQHAADLLIRIGRAGLVQAKWTEDILDEALGSLAHNRPDITKEKLTRLRKLINSAIPDCLVTGYEPLIEGLKLPPRAVCGY